MSIKKLKTNIEICGPGELIAIIDEMIELASRLQEVELTIKTGLPGSLKT
jgi:hypothetical protein